MSLHVTDDNGFWNEGPGAFMWLTEEDGARALLLIVPFAFTGIPKRPWQLLHLFVDRSATDWNQEGGVHAWDGNIENPTLTGSILSTLVVDGRVVDGWHGYLRGGILVGA